MNQMNIMDRSGHLTVEWNPDDPADVEAARKHFNEMVDKGYRAYSIKLTEDKDQLLKEFDPKAKKIMIIPPLQGG